MVENRRTGAAADVLFACGSDLRPDPAVLDALECCLAEEYGNTYVNRRVYDRGWLAGELASGRLVCAAAFTAAGEAAACICLRESPPFRGVGELCMHVVRAPFRGFGLGTGVVAWLMAQPETERYSAIGAQNATFHTLSQRESRSCGLRPCGMLFNRYRSQGFDHSSANIGRKLSYALAVLPRGEEGAVLCPPEEHRAFLAACCAPAGMPPVRLLERGEPEGESWIEVLEDSAHDSLTLWVHRCGTDLPREAARLLERAGCLPLGTATACLDLTHPAAAWGYEALAGLGFCFSGVQPFCRGRHYLLLHHPMGVEIPFARLKIDPQYQAMFRYIRARFP